MSRSLACLLIWLCGAGFAAAAENGARLLGLFQATCGQQPATAHDMDALARPFGYVSNGPSAPDAVDEVNSRGLIYDWRLPSLGRNFAVNAFLVGDPDRYQFDCSIHSDDVEVDDFVAGLRAGAKLGEPKREVKSDSDATTLSWSLGPKDAPNSLTVSFSPSNTRRSAAVSFTYWVMKR